MKNYISGNVSDNIINDTPHMAANLGKENRYTMQVTGIYV